MSFITRETDSVNNEVKVAFPSITCIWTSVNILRYGLILILISWLPPWLRKIYQILLLSGYPTWRIELSCLLVRLLHHHGRQLGFSPETCQKWKKKYKKTEWPIPSHHWPRTWSVTHIYMWPIHWLPHLKGISDWCVAVLKYRSRPLNERGKSVGVANSSERSCCLRFLKRKLSALMLPLPFPGT